MKYFTTDFTAFFKDLAANNHRDWFTANKARYEASVKKPFEVFVTDLITALAKKDKSLKVKPGDCIFRINRDIRFSKDKTPYKLNASAAISAGGRKDMESPGIYVELGPEKMALAGGIYMPSKTSLENIRKAMARQPETFVKLLKAPAFKKNWGDLQGDRNKIIPPALRPVAEKCPYIYNKQFYFWTELSPSLITKPDLIERIVAYYTAGKDVSDFLGKAMKR
ncbi:MAG: DUF2461 domain-containing protein [Flavobacteriales bacterium]|nr:DUF2461 domain-containing protein [Flavobacteriales bacterium]